VAAPTAGARGNPESLRGGTAKRRGELARTISIDLKAVDPYDALRAIAQAHGLDVRYSDDIVTVGAE
jgi:hypothetical protein